jgi:two-component system CheB/CheR fusion protein
MSASSDGPGKGAAIILTLPISHEDFVSTPSEAGEDRDAPERSDLRILLVEDHEETAAILAKLLQRNGHTVKVAGSVASALEIASSDSFDVVISDIGLPDGTGHELMEQISQKHAIPGVALTGYGTETDLARSRETGFAEHVVKPVDLAHLQAVITRVVKGSRGRRANRSS